MNMNQIRAPIPTRAPKLVMPKGPAPWDIATALTEMEHDVYEALVKEPAVAAGITPPPELPGPGTITSMLVAPLQGLLGGLPGFGQGKTSTPSPSPETKTSAQVEKPVEEEIVS